MLAPLDLLRGCVLQSLEPSCSASQIGHIFTMSLGIESYHANAARNSPGIACTCIMAGHVPAHQDHWSSEPPCAGLQLALQCLQVHACFYRNCPAAAICKLKGQQT